MEGVHDLRFAELGGDEFLPLHLDDPWSLRFLVMLEGSHDFVAEEETIPMYSKQIWFINGWGNKYRVEFILWYRTRRI